MSRASRFSKLEGEREGHNDKPASGASLERFASEPELGPRAEPVDSIAPQHGAERLQRFEADGNQGLGLDRDPLARLPMLECPSCRTACGKFEIDCHACKTSLTTPAAREHNLQRLEALLTERAAGQEAVRAMRQTEQIDAELQGLQARSVQTEMADDLHEKFSGESKRGGAWKWWVAIGCTLLFAMTIKVTGLKVLGYGVFTALLLSRLPRSVWLHLGQKARPRDRY